MTALLELNGISKSFPGVKALENISLSLNAGEVHALLGENGAGKSTLMKILCGIYSNDEGTIAVEGQKVAFSGYLDAIDAGIGIIFQEFSLIPSLNAVENIFLNREFRARFGTLDRAKMKIAALQIFKRLEVDIDLDCPISELSIAEQQFIEIAKALSLDARILVLDEPTATLTPKEAERLFSVMSDLRKLGVGMFFISHHLEEIFEICDRITVLRDGTYVGTKEVSESSVDDLVEMMVGRKVENTFPAKEEHIERLEPILSVDAIQLSADSPNNQFKLYPGEILGFAGLVGSGRTETVKALIGADPAHTKQVTLSGERVSLSNPAVALSKGIGLLPEDRKEEGLILPFAVKDNITLNNFADELVMGRFIHKDKEASKARDLIQKVQIKTPDEETEVNNLSGGNQQKVVIARWLNNDCKILIFDEPTRGIDVGAKAEIYELIRALTRQGIAIIMVSSELPEIIGLCDRVVVFREGEIVADLTEEDINSNTIMLHATGQAA
ncbi:sugar ABC transporter ATP-binding protein [Vibrio nigripulchritudo]|uniref:sugar ABC transporter ATP-binding protein n=1 Tax=Vibrio nigripulchritudo TaxID=28173 RepID=UPI0003B22E91|nr:sugar ABC transporter ATP-binding protein [Vibrio nigripulchritudo]CCN72913.1 Ribose import ATP-binding protein rbsA [Vibrio nigripulchritudo SFn118]